MNICEKGGFDSTLFCLYLVSGCVECVRMHFFVLQHHIDDPMERLRLIPIIAVILLLVACNAPYQIRKIDVLRPSSYTLPSNVKRLVLVNNTLPYRNEQMNLIELNGVVSPVDTFHNDRMASLILQSLQAELQERGFFTQVSIDTLSQKKSWIHRSNALTPSQINDIALRAGADAVVSLDDYSYSTLLQITSPEPNWYFALMSAQMNSLWRFSAVGNPNQGTFEIQKDTLFWSGEGLTPDLSVRSFPNYGDIFSSLASYGGYNFVNQITPYWESISRIFFAEGNEYFVNAALWAQKENWSEANKLWNYVLQNGKPIEKARAAVNLSYAMEIQGFIDEAALWCAKGLALYDAVESRQAMKEKMQIGLIFKELINRQKEIERLNKQMGQ